VTKDHWTDEMLKDAVRRSIQTDYKEALTEHVKETAFCCSPVELYAEAPYGWNPIWQRANHSPECPYCRVAVRIAFRNGKPGWGMLLRDRNNGNLPGWWRDAIGDYIRQHPALRQLETVERISGDAIELMKGTFRSNFVPFSPAAITEGGASWRGGGAEREESGTDRRDRIASAYDSPNHIEAVLFHTTKGGKQTILLIVRDLLGKHIGHTIQVSIVGEDREIVTTLKLREQEEPVGVVSGECEISMDEFHAASRAGFVLSPPVVVERDEELGREL
jgi:hypothetical protein